MGNACGCIDAPAPNRQVSIKLLLLGAGESGKSTVFKQLKLLNQPEFSVQEKNQYRPFVLWNLVEGAAILINESRNSTQRLTNEDSIAAARIILRFYGEVDELDNGGKVQELSEEVHSALRVVGGDPIFQQQMRTSLSLVPDGWSYFIEKIVADPTWGTRKWMPDTEDVLHVRARTVGIVSTRFTYQNKCYEVTDVGGQRAERKKWTKLFFGVSAIIFMQPLSDYDEMLFEEKGINRFVDSFELWKKHVNLPEFSTTPYVVFLNKEDLLLKKFVEQKIPFEKSLGTEEFPVPVYSEGLSADENLKLVKNWYENRLRSVIPEGVNVNFKPVTALSRDRMQDIFQITIFSNLFEKLLATNGFAGI